MIEIVLPGEKYRQAREAGLARQKRRAMAGVERNKYTFRQDTAQGHIDGVLGEMVLSEILGIPWTETLYTEGEADVGNFEARLRTRHWYEMIILPKDKEEGLFFHITKEPGDPKFRVHGCISGSEGKRIGEWKQVTQNPPTFFVKPKLLAPIDGFLFGWVLAKKL